jgi:hypothetical protein
MAPGYPVTPILFVLLVATIVLMIGINRPVQAAAGLVVLLFGLVAHQAMTSAPKPK